ncbi:MAG: MATE family efflux transporter, partial [Bacteroidia bacterium]
MGANLLVSLWLLPYVLNFLSKSEYAVFAITADIVAWLALTSLGVGPSLNVRAGQFIGQKNYSDLNTVTNAAFWGQLLLSLIIVGFGVFALNYPSQIISESINEPNLGWVLFLLILGGAIGFIGQPLNGLLTANKQIHIDNYLKFGTLTLRTLLTIFFLNLDFKLMSIALSNIIALGLALIITYWRVKSSIPSIRLHPLEFKSVEFKK